VITDLGSVSIGAVIPAGVTLGGLAAADVQGQLAALATFTPQVSLSFAAQLEIATRILANIEACIAAGLTPPSLSVQVDMCIAAVAALNAKLTLILGITSLFATAGVHLFVFEGAQNNLGSELSTALGVSPNSAHALAIVTQDPTCWTAMGNIFKTS